MDPVAFLHLEEIGLGADTVMCWNARKMPDHCTCCIIWMEVLGLFCWHIFMRLICRSSYEIDYFILTIRCRNPHAKHFRIGHFGNRSCLTWPNFSQFTLECKWWKTLNQDVILVMWWKLLSCDLRDSHKRDRQYLLLNFMPALLFGELDGWVWDSHTKTIDEAGQLNQPMGNTKFKEELETLPCACNSMQNWGYLLLPSAHSGAYNISECKWLYVNIPHICTVELM